MFLITFPPCLPIFPIPPLSLHLFVCHPPDLIKYRTRRTRWRRTASALWPTEWFRSRGTLCTQISQWRSENHHPGLSRARERREEDEGKRREEEILLEGNGEDTYPKHLDRCGSEGEGKQPQAHHGLFLPLYLRLILCVCVFFLKITAISQTRTQALSSCNFFSSSQWLHTSYRYQSVTSQLTSVDQKLQYQQLKLESPSVFNRFADWRASNDISTEDIDWTCWRKFHPKLNFWTASSRISWSIWQRSYWQNEKKWALFMEKYLLVWEWNVLNMSSSEHSQWRSGEWVFPLEESCNMK